MRVAEAERTERRETETSRAGGTQRAGCVGGGREPSRGRVVGVGDATRRGDM